MTEETQNPEQNNQESESPPEQPPDWLSSLPDDLRGRLGDVKSPADLARAYIELQKKAQEASTAVPGEDAPEEAWERFWNAAGRPSSPEGYTLPEVDGVDWNQPLLTEMKKIAHAAGVTKSQWSRLVEGLIRVERQQLQQQREEAERVSTQLQQEWGGAYQRKLGLAQRVIRTLGGEDVLDAIDRSPLGNHPGFIRMMARIGEALAEEGVISAAFEGQLSKEDAVRRINELTLSEPYLNPNHPDHSAAVEEARKLFEYVYG